MCDGGSHHHYIALFHAHGQLTLKPTGIKQLWVVFGINANAIHKCKCIGKPQIIIHSTYPNANAKAKANAEAKAKANADAHINAKSNTDADTNAKANAKANVNYNPISKASAKTVHEYIYASQESR